MKIRIVMNKYCTILVALILLYSLSCNTNRNYHFNKKLIKSIAQENTTYPSRFFGIFFFCKCHSNEILSLDIYEIREIYANEFKHIDYYTFLTDLLNQKQTIQCKNHNKTFKINEDVKKKYSEGHIGEFVGYYCENQRNNLYVLKRNVKDEQRNTIFYFLFVNNYLTNFDDYSGTFVIKKSTTD